MSSQSIASHISIIVDYAHEPESMRLFLDTMRELKQLGLFDYIIHIVSCDGVGRDEWKKPILGKLSFDLADYSVVTLDNYNEQDDPEDILRLLTQHFDGSRVHEKYQIHKDRGTAFDIALTKADEIAKQNKKVIICSTGVGCEFGLTQPVGVIPWDEKAIWKEKFAKRYM